MVGAHLVDAEPYAANAGRLVALVDVCARKTKQKKTKTGKHGRSLRVYTRRSPVGCVSYITITECTGVVEPVALVARAHVAAERVRAVAVLAYVVVFFALVHVLQDHL